MIAGGGIVITNEYTGTPAFSADGYHLTANSAAIDRGVSTGVMTDIDGQSRDAVPDLGADEYRTCWARVNNTPTDYTTIQAAVDAAGAGDTVKVTGYCAGVQARGGVTQTVYISKNITLRGGYTTTNWTTSDPVANPTILDAQGKGRVINVASGITSTLEGLRITGGNANGLGGAPWGWDAGGGVYAMTATVALSNSQFFSNTAFLGGGLALFGGNATVSGNTITSSDGSYAGGALVPTWKLLPPTRKVNTERKEPEMPESTPNHAISAYRFRAFCEFHM